MYLKSAVILLTINNKRETPYKHTHPLYCTANVALLIICILLLLDFTTHKFLGQKIQRWSQKKWDAEKSDHIKYIIDPV